MTNVITLPATVARQENICSTLFTLVSCAKWPVTFVSGLSCAKPRMIIAEVY